MLGPGDRSSRGERAIPIRKASGELQISRSHGCAVHKSLENFGVGGIHSAESKPRDPSGFSATKAQCCSNGKGNWVYLRSGIKLLLVTSNSAAFGGSTPLGPAQNSVASTRSRGQVHNLGLAHCGRTKPLPIGPSVGGSIPTYSARWER